MRPPELFVFLGLIASGKSTLAQAWAEHRGIRYHNSDVVRKELAGIAPNAPRRESVDQGIYTAEFTARTYGALLSRAEAALTQAPGVVLDASYQRREDRDAVRGLASRLGARVYFILCLCPEDEMRRRMEARGRDPLAVSDGRWEIYLKQKERFEPPDELPPGELLTVSTDRPVDELVQALATSIEETP
ncbi:MAG: AAA family ATPase [Thermodesulfobacteriota bacterium]